MKVVEEEVLEAVVEVDEEDKPLVEALVLDPKDDEEDTLEEIPERELVLDVVRDWLDVLLVTLPLIPEKIIVSEKTNLKY